MPSEVANLPFALQVAVLGGVLAFLLANYGRLDHHQPSALAVHIAAWTLVTAAIVWIVDRWLDGALIAVVSILVVLILAICWRSWLSRILAVSARKWGFSFVNDEPSALATLQNDCDHAVSQIAVLVDSGEWLRCDNTVAFKDAPFGPCQIGPKGDVAMYVTHIKEPAGTLRALNSTMNEGYGARITYIPAERISRMNLRYIRRR